MPRLRARLPDRLHRDRLREERADSRIDHLAIRYRYRQVHVLRPVQRAVSDRLDPSYDRVRGRGLLAREPDSPLRARAGGGLQGQKGPRARRARRPTARARDALRRRMGAAGRRQAARRARRRSGGRGEARGPRCGCQARPARSRRRCGGEARRSGAGCRFARGQRPPRRARRRCHREARIGGGSAGASAPAEPRRRSRTRPASGCAVRTARSQPRPDGGSRKLRPRRTSRSRHSRSGLAQPTAPMLNTLAAQIIFYFVAAITVGFAALVAFSRNIVYSAFALVGALMGVAGIYILLAADFVAMVQVLLYVGGIVVLTIFAVMLTQGIGDVAVSNRAAGPGRGLDRDRAGRGGDAVRDDADAVASCVQRSAFRRRPTASATRSWAPTCCRSRLRRWSCWRR